MRKYIKPVSIHIIVEIIHCPACSESIDMVSDTTAECKRRHVYPIVDGILDLMSDQDVSLCSESDYWDNVAQRGWTSILPNKYMDKMLFDSYVSIFQKIIKDQLPDYRNRSVTIVEVGCGSGSAIALLREIEFASVSYIGIDVSMEMMRLADRGIIPKNWNVRFVRSSANVSIFKQDSIDIAFSTSVLHNFDLDMVFKWISRSLKRDGMFILNEPSAKNPLSRIGRHFLSHKYFFNRFFSTSKKRLLPNQVSRYSEVYRLDLEYEKGMHFASFPLYYIFGYFTPPKILLLATCYLAKVLDRIVTSPSWSYNFIQVYRKKK
jgi:ubiquinone/menaquinone biosynthesis C-methylase UbiE/uncharacterized protein YbaR (Trm112 family)